MSEVPDSTAGDEPALAALRVLLDGAAGSFRTIQVSYRTWRHEQRLRDAFRANFEEQRRRGVAISIAAAARSGDPGPAETEETVRIWRAGQRVREEHAGGRQDGYYGVADGPLWWLWTEQTGAVSNRDDPRVGGGVGRGFAVLTDPAPLLDSLDLRVAGHPRIAGRAAVSVDAAPRPAGLDPGMAHRELHALGVGAEGYRLEVDRERGVLLEVTAVRNAQPFYQITTLAISFDEPIPEETFRFRPPAGEEVQSSRGLVPRPQLITVTEAQQRAAFTVLVPGRVPAGWRAQCMFVAASARPPFPAHVLLSYRSDDGHRGVSISQLAAADAARHHRQMLDDASWKEVAREGTAVWIRPAGELPQAQAHLERNGTFVLVASDSLIPDDLATIAAGLKPVPDPGST